RLTKSSPPKLTPARYASNPTCVLSPTWSPRSATKRKKSAKAEALKPSKASTFFPMTAKKVIRAQNIAIENRIPTIYLVDSAGVFLPLQEDVFPDTDD